MDQAVESDDQRRVGGRREITKVDVVYEGLDTAIDRRVAIKTLDYVEYVVERNIKGKELLALVDEKVRATGTIRERVHGDMIMATALDTTAALAVKLSARWSAASPSNRVYLQHLLVEIQ